MFRGVPGVLEGQIRQDQPDVLTVLIVPSKGYSEVTAQTLQANARARIGGSMGCEVKLVDEIPRAARGKFKSVVCNV